MLAMADKGQSRSLMRSLGLFVGHIAKAIREDPRPDPKPGPKPDPKSGPGPSQTIERIETPAAEGTPGKVILRRTTTNTTIEEVEVDRDALKGHPNEPRP